MHVVIKYILKAAALEHYISYSILKSSCMIISTTDHQVNRKFAKKIQETNSPNTAFVTLLSYNSSCPSCLQPTLSLVHGNVLHCPNQSQIWNYNQYQTQDIPASNSMLADNHSLSVDTSQINKCTLFFILIILARHCLAVTVS